MTLRQPPYTGIGVYPRACGGTCHPAPVVVNTGMGVYPRACGGTWRPTGRRKLPHLKGLSPRVRGNLGWFGAGLLVDGSIPARAGEPEYDASRMFFARVYPRACGGTSRRRPDASNYDGLSPRVRGNRVLMTPEG